MEKNTERSHAAAWLEAHNKCDHLVGFTYNIFANPVIKSVERMQREARATAKWMVCMRRETEKLENDKSAKP